MFDRIFLSLQVKRSVINSNKHGIHVLPYDLPNDLALRILRNQEISGKSQNFIKLQTSALQKKFVNTRKKKLLKNRYRTFPVVHYFTPKLEFVSNILPMIVALGRQPIALYILSLSRFNKLFTVIQAKPFNKETRRLLKFKNTLKILGNQKISGKSQNFVKLQPSAQSCSKKKLSVLEKNS